MESYRDALVRELAELEAQLKDMAGFGGFIGGAGTVSDDSEELIPRVIAADRREPSRAFRWR
jgi:hypothetical protein